MSVIERGLDGEPHVAFGPSAETRVEDRREVEEQRRLLYVAMTRARDRLYLAAEAEDDGRLKRAPHSLAALLPASLMTAASVGARSSSEITWDSHDGSFAFRVVRSEPAAPRVSEPVHVPTPPGLPLPHADPRGAIAATAIARTPNEGARGAASAATLERLTGTLVHRLFERRLDVTTGASDVQRLVLPLARAEELVDVADVPAFERTVVELYQSLRRRKDVGDLLGAGTCLYEVPFSYQPPGRREVVIRGVVDCLVLAPDGRVTVLEFKTGQPRPEHEQQVAVYADAIGALFGHDRVAVKIVYP